MNSDTREVVGITVSIFLVLGIMIVLGFVMGYGYAQYDPIEPLPGQTFKCGEAQVVKVDGKYVEGKACESEGKR